MARAKELGLVCIGGRVDDGANLVQGDPAVRSHAEGEHQVVASSGTAFDYARPIDTQYHALPAGRIHQAGVGVLHGQRVAKALQSVSARLDVEQAAEVSGGVLSQVRLVHLQLQGAPPGHAGADVVVVVVGRVGLILPVLITGAASILQVRAARVEGGVAEQHVGTIGADQRSAADEGLPFSAHQLEGDVGAVDQPGIGAAVGDDEETSVRGVQATEIGAVTSALLVHVGPDHLAAERGAVVALDVIAIAVAEASRSADEGHRGVEVQGADLNGRGVVIDGHSQAAGGRVIVLVGDLVADVEGNVVLGSAGRVHQRLEQVDGVGAAGRIGQHHGHQVATAAADGQGVGSAIPGGDDALTAQGAGPGQFDGLEPIGADTEVQRATGADAGACHIAGATVDATREAFVVEHGRRGAVAGSGRIVPEADGLAQIEAGTAGITILVGNGRHQFHQVRSRQTSGLVRPTVRRMDDGTNLIESDVAGGIHRDLEGNGAGIATDTAYHLAPLKIQLDIAATGAVLQTAVGTLRLDLQRIADGAGTVGAVVAGEGTTEVGGGVDRQVGLVHLQAGDTRLAGADGRRVVPEADGVTQVEAGAARVAVLVGNGRHQFHQVRSRQPGGLIRPGVGRMHDGQFLVEGDLAVGIRRDGKGNRSSRATHAADHLPALEV